MADARIAKRFHISGIVQGVGYRYFAQRVAVRIGIRGYVRNLRDGRVEVYAIGSPSELSRLRPELERGPHGASVSEVIDEDAEVEEKRSTHFSIERDS